MTAATFESVRAPRSQRLRPLLELLASMRFAIALLTVICIASVIGTVLHQQEPVANYVNQFGPFWAALFLAIRLNAVYSAWWFLLILAFLVTSTSLCIARNAPKILADLRAGKENLRESSLAAFHHRAEAALAGTPAQQATRIGQALARGGWKVRLQERSNGWMVAARAGRWNKLGYLAAHGAIVLVCVGGLLDGDLIVRAQMLLAGKTPYRGGGLLSAVPAQHRLPSGTVAFRGNLLVAEGSQSSTAVLNQSDGIVLQELPFSIELRKFVIEHYTTGMPKLFASDIVLHDKDTGEQTVARVEVNHPVVHRGIAIYQSGFDDGGSTVKLQAVPLDGSGHAFQVQGQVGGSTELAKGAARGAERMTLEYTALRTINVENLAGAPGSGTDVRTVDLHGPFGAPNRASADKALRNVGPSVQYKLRDAAGQAREFHNYMLPVDLGDGVPVFLLGERDNPDAAFRYLRIPADENGSLDGYVRLRTALADPQLRAAAVQAYARKVGDPAQPEAFRQLQASAERVLAIFAGAAPDQVPGGGLSAISDFIEMHVPAAERTRAGEALLRIVEGTTGELERLAREQAGVPPLAHDARGQAFLTQAVLALSDGFRYPAPIAFELKDFRQVQASVFQVTRSPGHLLVYLGCALLILGVFAMLFIRERRLWVWLAPSDTGTRARMALSSNRKLLETDREFERLQGRLLGDKP